MYVDVVIIGQGISGTWLSYYLQKAGKSFLVIDNHSPAAPSRVAAGLINPVTGRRIVKTWMIDELLSFIVPAYEELGNELGLTGITRKPIIDFHPTPQMKLAFDERQKENADFLFRPLDENNYHPLFNYDFGYGIVDPGYIVNLAEIIPAWRNKLVAANCLLEENFDPHALQETGDGILYKNIRAGKIIFCDGISSSVNPYFKNLPFSLNKGEAIIIESKEIPTGNIFKKGMVMVPLDNHRFWIGSNYLWSYPDDQPTEAFRKQVEQLLRSWLKVPYKILDHKAAIRPANMERRPFLGFHPVQKNIGILNGMGTKGCSLSPYFARQLADHLTNGKPLLPEADINRFKKILSNR